MDRTIFSFRNAKSGHTGENCHLTKYEDTDKALIYNKLFRTQTPNYPENFPFNVSSIKRRSGWRNLECC